MSGPFWVFCRSEGTECSRESRTGVTGASQLGPAQVDREKLESYIRSVQFEFKSVISYQLSIVIVSLLF